MATVPQLVTADDLARADGSGQHVELVRGELVMMTPAGHLHGRVAANIAAALHSFVRRTATGETYAAETGFVLSRHPDTVRAPDAAFVTLDRSVAQVRSEGFFDGAPDLAVEVISPNEPDEAVHAKVLDYLRAGTRLVWIVYPSTRTVTVYRSLTDIRVVTADGTLDGHDVLPGFALAVEDVFR